MTPEPTTIPQSPVPSTSTTTPPPSVTTATGANYASFLERFLASLIDGIITSIISFVIGMIMGIITAIIAGGSDSGSNLASLLQGLASLLSFAISSGYLIYFIGNRGQTLGKMAMKIKVVKLTTNTHPSYLDAFLREVVGKIVSGLTLGIGYLWMLWDPQKQTLHDKIAGTIVVKA